MWKCYLCDYRTEISLLMTFKEFTERAFGRRGERNTAQFRAYIALNIIAWMIVIVWPILQGLNDGDSFSSITSRHFATYIGLPVMFLVLFYLDYYYLFDKLWKRSDRGRMWFLIINIFLILAISIGSFFWQNYFRSFFGIGQRPLVFANTVLYYSVVLMMTAGLSVTLRYTVDYLREEMIRRRLEIEQREAELRNLRAQLNPHFLFNAMNAIYALISIDAERAQTATHNLSKILRYVLYDDQNKFVPLEKELEFIRSYVDIMKLRLSDNVRLQADIDVECTGVMVAPLMFMSPVENAFKHGVSNTESSFIEIVIGTESVGDKCVVVCRVRNSYFPKMDNDRSGSGIGVENLRRRLELLYPDSYELSMHHDHEEFETVLKLYI